MKRVKPLIILNLIVGFLLYACTSTGGVPSQPINMSTSTSTNDSSAATVTARPGEATDSEKPAKTQQDYRIITLLPQDAIPAIDDPDFYTVEQADSEYSPAEQVIGVFFDGEARAYSTAKLSSHEIVNDTVAGRKIAVTW